jgi:hypothetical protein
MRPFFMVDSDRLLPVSPPSRRLQCFKTAKVSHQLSGSKTDVQKSIHVSLPVLSSQRHGAEWSTCGMNDCKKYFLTS